MGNVTNDTTQEDEGQIHKLEGGCEHVLYREGIWVKCKRCGFMLRDPQGTFPSKYLG